MKTLTIVLACLLIVGSINAQVDTIPIPGMCKSPHKSWSIGASVGDGFKLMGTIGYGNMKQGFIFTISPKKGSIPEGADYTGIISSSQADDWGDPIVGERTTSMKGSIGMYVSIVSNVYVYGALGVCGRQSVQERYDPMHILSSGGEYFINRKNSRDAGMTLGVILCGFTGDINMGYGGGTSPSVSIGILF